MKRLVLIAGFAAALASPAVAQSYKCVSGELLGGPEGYSCETNAQGEIVSVRPGKSTQTTTRTVTRSAPTTRTVTRSATTTHSAPHTHGSNSHNHPHTHTDGTRHSHPHSHGAQHTSHRAAPTVTRTTSRLAPRQRLSDTPPKRPVHALFQLVIPRIRVCQIQEMAVARSKSAMLILPPSQLPRRTQSTHVSSQPHAKHVAAKASRVTEPIALVNAAQFTMQSWM